MKLFTQGYLKYKHIETLELEYKVCGEINNTPFNIACISTFSLIHKIFLMGVF